MSQSISIPGIAGGSGIVVVLVLIGVVLYYTGAGPTGAATLAIKGGISIGIILGILGIIGVIVTLIKRIS